MIRRLPRPILLALVALSALFQAAVTSVFSSPSRHRPAFTLDLDGVGNLLHWALGGSTSGVPYQLVRDNVPFGSDGERAIHDSFAAWSRASSTLDYRFDGYTAEGSVGKDGRNVVFFIYGDWPYDSAMAAVTFRWFDNRSGALLDTDIAFNAVDYPWTIGGPGLDIQNSATHEVGHACGLGHSAVTEATMFGKTYAGETIKRTLHDDDLAGLAAIYGSGAPPTSPSQGVSSGSSSSSGGGGGGGCSTGASAGDALFAALVSLLFLTSEAARRARHRNHAVAARGAGSSPQGGVVSDERKRTPVR
jgi:hypothetical protein